MNKILVTGVGSLLGQGILKTILSSKIKVKIVGTDYFEDAVGFNWVNKSYLLPDILSKKNFRKWKLKILEIIKTEKISLIIPGLDFELKLFSKLKTEIEKRTACKVIVSSYNLIRTFQDKWKTYKYLKKYKFPYPETTLPENLRDFLKKNKFPLIVKPRRGHTSKNVFLVQNKQELKLAISKCKNSIVQEYLFDKNNEFTCGTICFDKQLRSAITLKRKLKNGNTILTIHKKDKNFKLINEYIKKLTLHINPYGPLNFQLCLTNKGPVVFEVNPRFSGTAPIRSIYGLNEFKVLIDALRKKRINKIKYRYGTVIRYLEDLFIENKYFL